MNDMQQAAQLRNVLRQHKRDLERQIVRADKLIADSLRDLPPDWLTAGFERVADARAALADLHKHIKDSK